MITIAAWPRRVDPGLRLPQAVCASLLLLACALNAAHGTEPSAIESPAGPDSLAPALAMDADRNEIVMTWLESVDDGHVLRFSRFDGTTFSNARDIAHGNRWFANWADTPALFVAANGDFIAHWLEKSADSTYAYDIRLSHSSDRGLNWSPPVTPHDDGTPTEHGFVAYFERASGETGMVWLDGRATGGAAQGHDRHGAAGVPDEDASEDPMTAGPIPGAMTLRTADIAGSGRVADSILLDASVCDCCQTGAALTARGPVVVYRDRRRGEIRDIAIIGETADGWSKPRLVHADGWKTAACPVNGPAVAADGNRLAVAWFTMADQLPRVRIAFSADAGRSFMPPRSLSEGKALGRVQLARFDDGFLLSWMEESDRTARLRLAAFDHAGRPIGEQTVGRLARERISGFPRIAVIDEHVLIVWTGTHEGRRRILTASVGLDWVRSRSRTDPAEGAEPVAATR